MLSNEVKLAIWLLSSFMAVLTMFFNLYILLMNLRSYRQNGHWLACETIITALSLASSALQLVSHLWFTFMMLDTECLLRKLTFTILLIVIFSLKYSIMWLTSFLTFFYSTKLVIEPIHCYTKIQEGILKHVTTVVLVIPLCGFGFCAPLMTFVSPENITAINDCTLVIPGGLSGKAYMIYYLLIAEVVPGLLMVKCSISISVHLAIHLQHMKASNNGFHAPKLGAEMRVIRMNLCMVAMFLCFLVVDIYVHYENIGQHENFLPLSILFSSIYTAACALLLIYGKKTFWKELLCLYNSFLDNFLCLSGLKVLENRPKPVMAAPGH